MIPNGIQRPISTVVVFLFDKKLILAFSGFYFAGGALRR
jgi:hypothetical protein